MREDCHVDLSNKFFTRKTTGIACIGINSKRHKGCALSARLKKDIETRLSGGFAKNIRAKLYAICIYYLVKDDIPEISRLVVCNDENFKLVKYYFDKLINCQVRIISIFEFRESLGRDIRSPADNYARIYAKRGLNKRKWLLGKTLNVVEITFAMIEEKWNIR